MNVSATPTSPPGIPATALCDFQIGPDMIVGHLLGTQHISAQIADQARDIARQDQLPLLDVLVTRFSVSPRALVMAEADLLGARIIDPALHPPQAALVRRYGPARALMHHVLPWRTAGNCTLVLAPCYDVFLQHRQELQDALGPVRVALCTRDQISAALVQGFAADLTDRAETRLPAGQSSRNWQSGRVMQFTCLGVALLAGLALLAPVTLITALSALAVALLVLSGAVKAAAALCGAGAPQPPPACDGPLPVITLLIPLYRERAIAEHLLTRLESLDYPRERLDVCLVLEDDDDTTRQALGRTHLLTWMRPVIVPKGTLRTKPRALNYALDFARGSIIGVYDAEDAPDPDQLRVVAATFAHAGPRIACLQGVLDYYNSTANWLTRCFTIEYASWFRVVLPGYARMGLVVPLGGTTLFFRRDILESLGAWDAHNVTEDADLGLRLARAGYETVFIPSVTQEEANGRFWPWVKQRSRWLKGYAVTYCVHMRNPAQLWRDLGARRFWGVQVLFAGTLSQFVLAPLIWSFWLIPLGFRHPAVDLLPPWAFWTMVGLFIASEAVNFAISALALRRAGKTWLTPWALTLQLYFPLGAIAVYKGLLELTWKPFYWDKTAHGILLPKTAARVSPPPRPLPHPAAAE
ncbi:glycosyltransferase family 2 protein [Loktanella salsilacus]|uniref:glycosyltransferase family 2 protein n=1 Tax=Loktanella salsilacus TaxID=195913 RepID=UPI0037360374